MAILRILGSVRRRLGGQTVSALIQGVGLPPAAQCWGCGEAITFTDAKPESVTLSAVTVGSVSMTAFAHTDCGESQVFTPQQFEAVASRQPSPVPATDPVALVDGQEPVIVVDSSPPIG